MENLYRRLKEAKIGAKTLTRIGLIAVALVVADFFTADHFIKTIVNNIENAPYSEPAHLEPCWSTQNHALATSTPFSIPEPAQEVERINEKIIQATQNAYPTKTIADPIITVDVTASGTPVKDTYPFVDIKNEEYVSAVSNVVLINSNGSELRTVTGIQISKDAYLIDNHSYLLMMGPFKFFYTTSARDKQKPYGYPPMNSESTEYEFTDCQVIVSDGLGDVAVLIKGKPLGTNIPSNPSTPFPINKIDGPCPKKDLKTISFPFIKGSTKTFIITQMSTGTINQRRKIIQTNQEIVVKPINATTFGGMSGAPILDTDGNVCGALVMVGDVPGTSYMIGYPEGPIIQPLIEEFLK